MENVKFLPISEQCYYIEHKSVILKCFEKVHMVKIRLIDTGQIMIVDRSALSTEPIVEKTIAIKMLGGN